jgi:hypothetical protein
MSVAIDEGRILITGQATIEDAETLLSMLRNPAAVLIVVEGCERLSTAVAQLLMASGLPIGGVPGDAFTRDLVLPAILRGRGGNEVLESGHDAL